MSRFRLYPRHHEPAISPWDRPTAPDNRSTPGEFGRHSGLPAELTTPKGPRHQMASAPRSPVRIRTTSYADSTTILPSPISPE